MPVLFALQAIAEASDSSAVTIATLAILVLSVASLWRVFTRAGEPGWAVLVPIYNGVVLLRVARRPVWWLLLLLIPGVNVVTALVVDVALARRFGRSAGFAVGLWLLPFVFLPVLAFTGDARAAGAATA